MDHTYCGARGRPSLAYPTKLRTTNAFNLVAALQGTRCGGRCTTRALRLGRVLPSLLTTTLGSTFFDAMPLAFNISPVPVWC